jgi:DNA polymerase I-like protein with 3'-5' exonuclease and polymerase domains
MSSGRKAREKGQIDKPNLQNIPKVGKIPKAVEARYCFVPEEGNVFVIADYASQESRLLADLTEDKGLLDFYLRGEADLHSYVAQLLWPEVCGDLHLDEVKDKHGDLRDLAKGANFAIAYGGTGHTIAENANIPDEKGEEVYNAYLSAFPGVAEFFEINLSHTLINGYITINQKTGSRTFPRHIPFSDDIEIDEEDESVYAHSEPAIPYFKKLAGEVESPEFQKAYKLHSRHKSELFWSELRPKMNEYNRLRNKLLRLSTNYLIQGTAALQTKMAGIIFYNQLLSRGWINIVKIVNVIHDEYVIECPAAMSEEVQNVLVDSMVVGGNYFMKQVVMEADAHIDTKWSK